MALGPDSTDEEILAALTTAEWAQVRDEDGVRRTWDPAAGLWLDDEELVRNWRGRQRARAVLGSEEDTAALNRSEGAPNPPHTQSPHGDHRSPLGYGRKRAVGEGGKNTGYR